MCGLVGVAGNLNHKTSKAFRNLLIMDQIRGFHSTGVGLVNGLEKTIIDKEVGTPDQLFLISDLFDGKGVLKTPHKAILGHNRAATLGEINKVNSHPFNFDHITGAHNGTLRDWFDLEGYKDFDVDSKALFKTIAVKGIDHCWKNFRGAAAITYWNAKDKTLNLLRNNERPLYAATIDGGKILMWASEEWMIKAACDSVDLKLDEDKESLPNPWKLKENYIHTYDVSFVDVKLKECRELKVKPAPTYTYGYSYRYNNNTNYFFNKGWATGLVKAGKESLKKKFNLTSFLTFKTANNDTLNLIQGRTLEDDPLIVQVVPESYQEFISLKNVINDEKFKDNIYSFTCRPRCMSLKKNGVMKVSTYRISMDNVDLEEGLMVEAKEEYKSNVSYMYRIASNDLSFNKEKAEEDLKANGGRCNYCTTQLSVDDDYQYRPVSGLVCDDCIKVEEEYGWGFGYGSVIQ